MGTLLMDVSEPAGPAVPVRYQHRQLTVWVPQGRRRLQERAELLLVEAAERSRGWAGSARSGPGSRWWRKGWGWGVSRTASIFRKAGLCCRSRPSFGCDGVRWTLVSVGTRETFASVTREAAL